MDAPPAKPASEASRHEKPDIARARDLVLSHGWNSTSFQIVNPGIRRWFSSGRDAVVGYSLSKNTRVVVGAPVCEKADLPAVAAEFEADAVENGQHVCYFAAETRLEENFKDSPNHTKFLLGAQPSWRPVNWPGIVSAHRSLRAQLNRARNKGVRVSEWEVASAREHASLTKVLREWLESKGLPPLHFMVESDTLSRLQNRRVFVAEKENNAVGFIVLSPIANRNGWLFEQFPHCPTAPNGTVELMIDTAMRTLATGGYEYATLGLSPLSKRSNVTISADPAWLRLVLAWLRKHGQRFYNFDGLDAFKAKLRPERWEPVFAISNEPRVSFKTLLAIAGAFSGNATARMIVGGLGRAALTEFRWLTGRKKR